MTSGVVPEETNGPIEDEFPPAEIVLEEPIAEIESGEDVGLPEEKDIPPFLRDEMPEDEVNQIKWKLLRGQTDKDLVEEGHNAGSVRTSKSHLVRDGYLKKGTQGGKGPGGNNRPPGGRTTTSVAKPQGSKLQAFAKGSPPEALISALEVPDPTGDGALMQFESGMKFGLTMLVTAVRLVSEMSIIGSQQVKPLLDMTKVMRDGEAMSYRAGADEAAFKAAQAMGSTILPEVAEIKAAVASMEKSSSGGGDPVKGMLVRTMEPLIQSMMGKMIPGAGGGGKSEPAGWRRRSE